MEFLGQQQINTVKTLDAVYKPKRPLDVINIIIDVKARPREINVFKMTCRLAFPPEVLRLGWSLFMLGFRTPQWFWKRVKLKI